MRFQEVETLSQLNLIRPRQFLQVPQHIGAVLELTCGQFADDHRMGPHAPGL